MPGCRVAGLLKSRSKQPSNQGTWQPISQLGTKLVERRLPEVDGFPFREQQILPHQVVNQPGNGLARGADHVGDRLMCRAGHRDVSVIERLSALLRRWAGNPHAAAGAVCRQQDHGVRERTRPGRRTAPVAARGARYRRRIVGRGRSSAAGAQPPLRAGNCRDCCSSKRD